jgi:hypothetical protein
MVRVKIENEKNSGNRKGWSKLVTSVDVTKTDGYAFAGIFLNDNTETDVPVGSVVVQKNPEGSVKNGWESGSCYVIGSDGKLYTTHSGVYKWKEQFLSLRDRVVKVMADPLVYLPEAAGGPPEVAPEAPPPRVVEAATEPKRVAIERIKALMTEHGITLADLA